MNTTIFNAWDNICDMIYEEQAKAQDKFLFEVMKANRQITQPVLICSRKIKFEIEQQLPNMFCILGTDLCEDDKAYMVTDERIANNIRQNLGWIKANKETESPISKNIVKEFEEFTGLMFKRG